MLGVCEEPVITLCACARNIHKPFWQIWLKYQRWRKLFQSRHTNNPAIPARGEFGGLMGGKHVSGGGARLMLGLFFRKLAKRIIFGVVTFVVLSRKFFYFVCYAPFKMHFLVQHGYDCCIISHRFFVSYFIPRRLRGTVICSSSPKYVVFFSASSFSLYC